MNNQTKALLGGGLILAFLAINKDKPVDRRKYVNSKLISVEITPAALPPMTNINT